MSEKTLTNAEFAKTDSAFRAAVDIVNKSGKFGKIEPSKRQSSKWRNHTGVAYLYGRNSHGND